MQQRALHATRQTAKRRRHLLRPYRRSLDELTRVQSRHLVLVRHAGRNRLDDRERDHCSERCRLSVRCPPVWRLPDCAHLPFHGDGCSAVQSPLEMSSTHDRVPLVFPGIYNMLIVLGC
jgi:hypothetical protein